MANELGVITGDYTPTPDDSYWNMCAALYAYLYGSLSEIKVEVLGES